MILLAQKFNDPMSGFIIVIAMMAIIFFILKKRKKESQDQASNQVSRKTISQAEKTIETMMSDLVEFNSKAAANLDTKVRTLNALLAESDDKIATLKKLHEDLSKFSQAVHISEDHTETVQKDQNVVKDENQDDDKKDEIKEDMKEKYADVYELKDENISEAEIASRLNMTISEVRFILNLRNI